MKPLASLKYSQLEDWIKRAKKEVVNEFFPTYIPLLDKNSNILAVEIIDVNQRKLSYGDLDFNFPFMSIIKPFLLFYLLETYGDDAVFSKVGKYPSGYPFNSLKQLVLDRGIPRNPMINSGAISLANLIPGDRGIDKGENLKNWLNQRAGCQLSLDSAVLASVQNNPNSKNLSLARELKERGQVEDANLALDTYNYICCLGSTVQDLAKLGMMLIGDDKNCQIVREIMASCGLYEASESFFTRVKIPSKSGVSGGIISVLAGEGAIAICHPPLNSEGNSILGLFLLEAIAQALAD